MKVSAVGNKGDTFCFKKLFVNVLLRKALMWDWAYNFLKDLVPFSILFNMSGFSLISPLCAP